MGYEQKQFPRVFWCYTQGMSESGKLKDLDVTLQRQHNGKNRDEKLVRAYVQAPKNVKGIDCVEVYGLREKRI